MKHSLDGEVSSPATDRLDTDDAIFALDPGGHVTSWNANADRAWGQSLEKVVGFHVSRLYGDEDQRRRMPEADLDIARIIGRFEGQGWRLRDDGSRFWALVVIEALHHDGQVVSFSMRVQDGTRQLRHSTRSQAIMADLRVTLSLLPFGVCLLDKAGQIVLSNPAFHHLFTFAQSERGAPSLVEVVDRCTASTGGAGLDKLVAAFASPDHQRTAFDLDLELGRTVVHLVLRPTESGGWVATFDDVGERRQIEQAAMHRAQHDTLTSLANRDALTTHLEALLAPPASSPTDRSERCSVFLLDLDRFKVFVDMQGHLVANAVLVETARRIRAAVRPEDFVARLGNDQFMVVTRGSLDAKQACEIGEQLRTGIAEPLLVEGRTFEVGVTVGIASSLEMGSTAAELIGCADSALFQARRDGHGVCVYDSDIGLSVLKRRTMELRLCQALGADEFALFYQPICSTDGRRVTGFEALIRWSRPSGGMVSPSEFIPLAEELGLMADIGGWVLETACKEAATWPAPLTVAVNVSAIQMHDPHFVERVIAALATSGLDPKRLEVEITETAMITDLDLTLRVLTRLREMGVMIAIDDFGTGYSSLSFLRTLPFTRVKIDRSFVNDVATNQQSMAIVRAVMSISRDLGLAVTAEGVETEAQRQILVGEACGEVQGYLFAKPMPKDRIEGFLRQMSEPDQWLHCAVRIKAQTASQNADACPTVVVA